MSNRSKNNRKNSNKNKQTHSNNNNRRRSSSNNNTNTSNTINPNNNRHTQHTHGSAMPIPHTRRIHNRHTGLLSSQMESSLMDSTYQRSKSKKQISNLKSNAPYNEHNSFFSAASPDQILHELTLILKSEADLDINIHPSGYKIRGRKFIANTMCEFQIEMFSTTQSHKKYPNHILVEFQRRNGDGFVFQQFLNSVFKELEKTKIVTFSKFCTAQHCSLSPVPQALLTMENEEKKENNFANFTVPVVSRSNMIDFDTVSMLIAALFDGDSCMRRSAASYLANNIVNNGALIGHIMKLEPLIIVKFSDLLLKCVDPQIVQSIGCTLYYMLLQSEDLKMKAIEGNMKTVCKKVYKRWTQPVETRYGTNNKYVIRVIPSIQVAQRMSACIQVLE